LQARLADKHIDIESEQIPLLMEAGDVAFMHPRLIHGSWPNTSNKPRRMFINGFSYPGANHKPYPGKGSTQRTAIPGELKYPNTFLRHS
jgi:ectoine hydroxylase-related dioxygenase (phytanoyl-CoA dioxygenase family)